MMLQCSLLFFAQSPDGDLHKKEQHIASWSLLPQRPLQGDLGSK